MAVVTLRRVGIHDGAQNLSADWPALSPYGSGAWLALIKEDKASGLLSTALPGQFIDGGIVPDRSQKFQFNHLRHSRRDMRAGP
jgi:hypothetical protein